MYTDSQDAKYKELTKKIIGFFYKVYNQLGYGFLEKVYENAMMVELEKESIPALAQCPIKVSYD
jgi:GxxExxY protein